MLTGHIHQDRAQGASCERPRSRLIEAIYQPQGLRYGRGHAVVIPVPPVMEFRQHRGCAVTDLDLVGKGIEALLGRNRQCRGLCRADERRYGVDVHAHGTPARDGSLHQGGARPAHRVHYQIPGPGQFAEDHARNVRDELCGVGMQAVCTGAPVFAGSEVGEELPHPLRCRCIGAVDVHLR